jgi:hypothetical protein
MQKPATHRKSNFAILRFFYDKNELKQTFYYYLLNLFSKRRCRMQLENLKIHGENLKFLKIRSNKSEKLQSLL